jgi:hypothetical protein
MRERTIGTKDVSTAAFLVARGYRVKGLSKEGRDTVLHFIPTEEIEEALDDWKFGEALVNGRAFSSARMYVLDLVHTDVRSKS